MNLLSNHSLFILSVVLILVISNEFKVDATRVLQGDFAKMESIKISAYPLYQKTRYEITYLLERLASGPSGGGGGN